MTWEWVMFTATVLGFGLLYFAAWLSRKGGGND